MGLGGPPLKNFENSEFHSTSLGQSRVYMYTPGRLGPVGGSMALSSPPSPKVDQCDLLVIV